MRRFGAAALAAVALSACTTVKVRQVGRCWVQETSRWMGSSREEVGPCYRAAPDWSRDRYTRLVQECVAQTDHQWALRAVAAWQEGLPLPPREPQDVVNKACFDAANAPTARENDALRADLESMRATLRDAATERAALGARLEQGVDAVRSSNAKLTEILGQVANKPIPSPAPAVATATSESRSEGRGGSTSESAARENQSRSVVKPRVPREAPVPSAVCDPKPPEASEDDETPEPKTPAPGATAAPFLGPTPPEAIPSSIAR